jgi:hypothetical protein
MYDVPDPKTENHPDPAACHCFLICSGRLLRYEGDGDSVTVPDTVRAVAGEVFRGLRGLGEAFLPDGLLSIGESAFTDCRTLSHIRIPDSLIRIGARAFRRCSCLPEITLPDGFEYIGEYAFEDCLSLRRVTLPGSLRRICGYAFFRCCSLAEIELPEGLICNDRCQEAICPNFGFFDFCQPEGISKGPWDQISGIGHSDIRGFSGCQASTLPTG